MLNLLLNQKQKRLNFNQCIELKQRAYFIINCVCIHNESHFTNENEISGKSFQSKCFTKHRRLVNT